MAEAGIDVKMSVPDYYRNVSLVLSRVMNDIGVNEECVMRRRRTNMLTENIQTLGKSLCGDPYTFHIFGSQTEGTTTPGLNSDVDTLFSPCDWRIIQDWKDWSPCICNYMMIRDETTFPGYCKLQAVRPDTPLLFDRLPDSDHVYDDQRRIILKNDLLSSILSGVRERHGPALQSPELSKRGLDRDVVLACYCSTWPKHYKQWSLRREVHDWPTPEMVEYMGTSGCFVVPVAHRYSERQDIEWRISTSLAERCLMFNLNITQIRCYVLLKMVTKTFIKPIESDVISSYICKTLLFHTLERTRRDFWREQNLLACVALVLSRLYSAVYYKNCPNYFHASANLLFGKLDQEGTRERLLFILRNLLHSQGRFLLEIGFDDINRRIKKYFLNSLLTVRYEENEDKRLNCCAEFNLIAYREIVSVVLEILAATDRDSTISRDLLNITLDFSKRGQFQYKAASLVFPFLCSHIATVDTSERIRRGQNVSPTALLMYKFSIDSDAVSSRLKFASFLYCTGQFKRVMLVLQQVELRMNSVAVQVSGRFEDSMSMLVEYEFVLRERDKPLPTTSNIGMCVMFSRSESQCCPLEMRFEYFRSADGDRLQRSEFFDGWMDLAVLDCLPFLHYLQYMAARHLGQRDLQEHALHKLIKSAFGKEYLGHRETAFNVLGQCMEHENRFDKALLCYRMSYLHQPRNNAVRWHLARLMYITNQRRR